MSEMKKCFEDKNVDIFAKLNECDNVNVEARDKTGNVLWNDTYSLEWLKVRHAIYETMKNQ